MRRTEEGTKRPTLALMVAHARPHLLLGQMLPPASEGCSRSSWHQPSARVQHRAPELFLSSGSSSARGVWQWASGRGLARG